MGRLAGKTLAQLSQEYQRDLVGDAARDSGRFPLLLKFLFPHEKLSVQVHPDDEQALRVGQPWGKTECWYIAHAKPGAQIALGLKPGMTVAQLEEAIHQMRAEEVLNWINVYAGDMIYVAGGTVHTLGPGSVVVETQQQSDTTYRLYDYGRPRELHLKEGMAAVKEKVKSGKVVRPAPDKLGSKSRHASARGSSIFRGRDVEVKEPLELWNAGRFRARSSVQILVGVEGCGVIEADGMDPVTMAKGDAVVVPACTGEIRNSTAVDVGILAGVCAGESNSRAGNENVERHFRSRQLVRCFLPLPLSRAIDDLESGKICDQELEFLSRNSGRRARHALLAAEPEEARQAIAGARRQADHDPADGCALVAAGSGEEVLDRHERRLAGSDRQATSQTAEGANIARTCRAEYCSGNWFGGVSVDARES